MAMPNAVELLARGGSEAQRLRQLSEQAAELFRVLGVDVAVTLTEQFAELRRLAAAAGHDRRADAARADMEKFLPTFIGQLQLLTDGVEQLLIAGHPLADAADKLRRALPPTS